MEFDCYAPEPLVVAYVPVKYHFQVRASRVLAFLRLSKGLCISVLHDKHTYCTSI